MKLLISPADVEEAQAAVEGGADIIDVKNPAEGSLGASFPWVVKGIRRSIPADVEVSATLGDLDGRPGFASLAAHGLASMDVDYIKAGLLVSTKGESQRLAASIVRAAKDRGCRVILAGYGDHRDIGSVDPLALPEVAVAAGADGVMVDTYSKKGSTLFDHMGMEELERFIEDARRQGLAVALAGSLRTDHIAKLKDLKPDIIGVRGAVCRGSDRLKGRIDREKVRDFKRRLR
ncbi:MAG: hypothetical protein D6733_05130 [Methanobacteriota archaeon]|nr:MAG: hypothetical protein D6733_05130 [Euryarchaeota archaeon]